MSDSRAARAADVLPAPSVRVAVAVPVLAAPIVRRVVESRLERVHTVSTTVAADEPPVRVHIGRLEVRANLEQPAPKPQRREPRAAAGADALRLPPRQAQRMSSPLAIGAVSAVLRNYLDNGLIDVGAPLSPVKITAVAPDTIKLDEPEPTPSLNLFLYRTSRNQGWTEFGLPSFDGNGSRVSAPPLALNLHYLLTAYGNADFEAEILLGYAMHLLHERPVLDRAAIRRALQPSPLDSSILPPAFQALTASDLADQIEAVTITDEPMDSEEMSRLWSAMQAHYRPTAAVPRLRRPDRGAQADAHAAAGAHARHHGRAEPAAAVPDDPERRPAAASRRRGSARR